MTFQEALKILNIEDYGERIYHSHSNGDLFHLQDFMDIAEALKDDNFNFREWFIGVVKYAEENWKRPESVFQHIGKILSEQSQQNINHVNL